MAPLNRAHSLLLPALALCVSALAFNLSAATVVCSYDAGVEGNPITAPSPAEAGWLAGNPTSDLANFVSAAVSPDGTNGLNAWRMLDNSSASGQFVTWNYAFTPQQHTDGANNGWRLRARLRAADPVAANGGANTTVLIHGNNAGRRWIAFYDITPTNTLLITLVGSPQLTYVITDTNVATGYNLHEMEFSPDTQRVTYRVNGSVLTTNMNNTTGSYNGVQWGTGSTGGKGDSYWNSLSFEILDPPPAPVAIEHPQPVTAAVGDSVTFSAVFTNSVRGFQWYKDGSPIGGATTSSYSIPFVTTLDAGEYVCRATNATGFGDTAPGTLTVLPDNTPPTVVRAAGSVFASRARLRFSEPVDPVAAGDAWNYDIAGGAHTVDAAAVVDRFTVDITISPALVAGSNYTVFVYLVQDTAGNEVVLDESAAFTVPAGWPAMSQLLAAFDGSSALPYGADGVTWLDRSGNENHAVSYSTATNTRPTLRTNSINGLSTLNFFRPSAQALRIEGATSTGLGGNAYTWFAVSKPTNFGTGIFPNLVRHQSSTDSAAWGAYFFPGNTSTGNRPGLVSNGRNSTGGEVAAISFPVAAGNWTLASGYANGPGSEVYSRIETPGSNTVLTATNTGSVLRFGAPVATWIGSSGGGVAAGAFDGEMAEVLIYSGALDEAQRAEVESYLRNKYFARAEVSIHRIAENTVIEFTGTLLSGDEANGITNVVEGATSPYTVPTGAAKQFYRSRLP